MTVKQFRLWISNSRLNLHENETTINMADVYCMVSFYRGFSRQPCWRAEAMKQFCMKIDIISQRRENVLFLPSNMAAMTSHENALYCLFAFSMYLYHYQGCSHYNSHYLNSSAEQSQPTKLLTSSYCREEYSKMSVPWRTWVVEQPLVLEGTLFSPS